MPKKICSNGNRRPIRYENWNGAIAIRYDGNIVYICHQHIVCRKLKLSTDKCHLFVTGHKFEHTWVRAGPDKIWEDHPVKLLGVSIDNELKFDKHVLNIMKKRILGSARYQD